jgi:zinc metalloprotease ZmpB
LRRFSALLIAATVAVVVLQPAGAGPSPSTGSGRVFSPNPVATLQDQSLTDQKDANYAALQPAYRTATLTNLDGSGYLQGDWANVRSNTGKAAFSPTNSFLYTRDDDRFEQVMAYYWVTTARGTSKASASASRVAL